MSSREEILGRLRSNSKSLTEALGTEFDMPDLSFEKTVHSDPVEEFLHQLTTAAGARYIEMGPDDDINEKLRQAYPEAGQICGHVPGLSADIDPDEVDDPRELDGIDVGVVQGGVACAENACVWVPMDMKQKAVCFIAENLVILVSRKNIVSNMHQAYDVLENMGDGSSRYGFGTFISGPSKTADIEQSLVFGAQAARSVTVLLTD